MRTTARAATRPSRPASAPAACALAGAIRRVLHARPRVASRRPRYATAVTLLTATLLCAGPLPVRAQSWSGTASSDWFDAANWVEGTVPSAGNPVSIDTFTPNPTVIAGGSVSTGFLFVGHLGGGDLTITNGGMLTTDGLRVGNDPGAQGIVRISGPGSQWTVGAEASAIAIGLAGTGRVVVTDGGTVESADQVQMGVASSGQGSVLVDGVGSTWGQTGSLYIGMAGSGALDVESGGTVNSEAAFVGYHAGGVGTATVTGPGSSWTTTGLLWIGNSGTGTLTIDAGGSVISANARLGVAAGSDGTATVTGNGSQWDNTGVLVVGGAGTGSLAIGNGGAVNSEVGTIGEQVSSQGAVTIAGPGSLWSVDGLVVGGAGYGSLVIVDGGTVDGHGASVGTVAGGEGTVHVDGAGSSWTTLGDLIVGDAGTGTLNIIGGGAVVTDSAGYLGHSTDSTGTVTVTGAGSTWTLDALEVGALGRGELVIADGGVVSSRKFLRVGSPLGATGTMLVTGAGSSWTGGDGTFVGVGGTGTLAIEDGGVVTDGLGVLGSWASGVGTAIVRGTGSQWNSTGGLDIGAAGNGTLTIADDGTVSVGAGIANLALQGGSTGTLNFGAAAGDAAVAAGMLDVASVVFGAGTGTINFNHTADDYAFDAAVSGAGTVDIWSGTTLLTGANTYTGATNVHGGTLLVEGALGDTTTTVADGATLGGSGAIAGDVAVANGGILAPGSSAGTLTVGSLSLSSGSLLDYELGQAGVVGGGVNDLIEITGDLTLDGSLQVTDIGGFGAGVYRLMNYGGDLTDHGLGLDAVPAGSDPQDLFVQTAVDGQVNLVNSTGLTLTFWDGAIGEQHNDGAISGGAGTWSADNDNWTVIDGALNGRWDDGEFAVFGGADGNVSVLGEQTVAGLQFMSGYTLAAGADGALSIGNAETIIRVDPNVSATISVDIGGAGGLVKTDTGTLVLSGDNTYAGGTTIRTGTLSVSADANLGGAAGGLVLDGGTLQNTAAFDSARDVDITAVGGTFLVDADLGLSGAISGAGALAKDGAGTLTLTGDNSYAGGTDVLAGTLVGDSGSIRGNLDNDGSIVFDQAVDGAFAGTITGDGAMAKRGVGALTLTGNSALDWSVDAGALVATSGFGGDAAIAAGALLRLAQTGDATHAGVLSGDGGFESGGSGTLVLTGDSAAFAGNTGVDAGTLQIDGALGGSVEIGAGAALSGDGMLGGAVRVLDGGRLAPGAGVGTLTVGSLWLSDGATLDYGLGQAGAVGGGANDLLEVTGDLTLDGTLDIADIGGFGAGVYRLINYGGDLTDNTLDIGALPAGLVTGDVRLQTSVDGQLNLVNSAGAVLGFWDGAAGPIDDGDIHGGDGVWTSVDRSWTDADGAINGNWSAGFAVFGGEAGTVTVAGTQAFTGLQFMTDGYRITGDALAMGTAETIVRVDRGMTATIDSALTGSGALVKHDAGTLVLSGENSYAGGTQLLGGVLAVGSDANLGAADGALAFDGGGLRLDAAFDSVRDITVGGGGALDSGAFDNTLAGVFSGGGTFTRIGSGTLTLVGASHGFAGTFALQSGDLRVDGSLGGTLAIANGAWLTGIGTLHDVDNHGTVAAGHSIGTLTFTGDYIHHDDATLLAEIEPGGSSDLFDIAGSATIEGGTVQVIKLPGQYEGGTRYTLIDAAGGVTGSFDTLGQDLPFLDLLLGYDDNHVYLDVQRNEVNFNIVCGDGTLGQCQVAGALDRIADQPVVTADLQAALAEVTTLDLPGAQAAFDRLSGEAHGSMAGLLLEGHALYGQAVSRRIVDRREAAGADRLRGGTWVRAYGASSDLDGDGNAHAADFEQRGLAVGFDAWGGEQWLIGASFNAMSTAADFRPGDHGEADAKNASLYASFQGERAYLDAVTSFAWWDNEITRSIEVGSIERVARSEYGGRRFATHLEAGWNVALNQTQQLTPLVSVDYAKLDQEGFREDGAQDLDLIGRSHDVERTTASAGLRWSAAFERGQWTLEPTAQVRWLHAFGDEHAEQDLAFAGAPDIGYRVRGVSWPQDRGLLGAGLQLSRGDSLDMFVDVDYQKGGGLETRALGAGVRWRW